MYGRFAAKLSSICYNLDMSTGEILNWVDSHSGETLVVTNEQGFAGLFTNPHMGGGLIDGGSLLELHGELTSIKNDPRTMPTATVSYPICPYCGYDKEFYRYNVDSDKFTCQECKQEIGVEL